MTSSTPTTSPVKLNEKAEQIMAAVWEAEHDGKEPLTSEAIAEAVDKAKFSDASSTTVASRCNQLVRKGLLAHNTRDRTWTLTPAGQDWAGEGKPASEPAKPSKGGNGAGDRVRLADQAVKAARAVRDRPASNGPRKGSMTDAMVKVLDGADEPMGAKDITAEIKRRRLAPNLKGKTPDATVGAKLATEAKKPGGLFERTGPGKFRLRNQPAAGDGGRA